MRKQTIVSQTTREAEGAPGEIFDPLLWEALPELTLNIAQTAALCGISVRQLGYWTQQGYVTAQGRASRRTYGLEAIRRVLAIRKAMNDGASLRQALRGLSAPASSPPVASLELIPYIASVLSTAEADALKTALLSFFAANQYVRDDPAGLAVKIGRSEEDVRAAAETLSAAGHLMKSQCQGLTIFQTRAQEASSYARAER